MSDKIKASLRLDKAVAKELGIEARQLLAEGFGSFGKSFVDRGPEIVAEDAVILADGTCVTPHQLHRQFKHYLRLQVHLVKQQRMLNSLNQELEYDAVY